MEKIFHEKQEGSLCAQHCLNSLLQGPYYDAVNLAQIAQELDEKERQAMALGNIDSEEYLDFMQQPSTNFDDSGYFSIQVLYQAIQTWNLQMIPFNSQAAEQSRKEPTRESAYICNQQNHWLTIRKLGKQWFNLNSLKACPELISDTYLQLLLEQLRTEGYSIFIISGTLPSCEASIFLEHYTISTAEYNEYVEKLRAAKRKEAQDRKAEYEKNKQKEHTVENVDNTTAVSVDAVDVREKRLNYFLSEEQSSSISPEENKEGETNTSDVSEKDASVEMSEEDMLKVAMAMSMECVE